MRAWQRLTLALLVAGLTGCDVVLQDEIDPSAPRIVPEVGPDAAVIATSGPVDAFTPGVEGSVLFVRLTDPDGTLVLDRPFEWPSDRQLVPPGDYTLVVYWRGCDGNCGRLSDDAPFCEREVTLEHNDRLEIGVQPSDLLPGSTCTFGQS